MMKKEKDSNFDYSGSVGRKITLDVITVAKQMGIPQQDIRSMFIDYPEKSRMSRQPESK